MKFKKSLCSALIISSILTTGVVSFADSSNDLQYSTKTKIVDNRATSNKTTESDFLQSDDANLVLKSGSKYTVTSKVACKLFTGNAISSSSVTRVIDFVSAKVRIYKSNGSLSGSDYKSQSKTTYVSATAQHGGIFLSGSKAYGNHEYRDSGYKTIYHETVDKW